MRTPARLTLVLVSALACRDLGVSVSDAAEGESGGNTEAGGELTPPCGWEHRYPNPYGPYETFVSGMELSTEGEVLAFGERVYLDGDGFHPYLRQLAPEGDERWTYAWDQGGLSAQFGGVVRLESGSTLAWVWRHEGDGGWERVGFDTGGTPLSSAEILQPGGPVVQGESFLYMGTQGLSNGTPAVALRRLNFLGEEIDHFDYPVSTGGEGAVLALAAGEKIAIGGLERKTVAIGSRGFVRVVALDGEEDWFQVIDPIGATDTSVEAMAWLDPADGSAADLVVVGRSAGNAYGSDLLLSRWGPGGELRWETRWTGEQSADAMERVEAGYDLAVAPDGRIYLVGSIQGPATSQEMLLMRWSAQGELEGWTTMGDPTSDQDVARAIAFHPSGQMYLAGSWGSSLGEYDSGLWVSCREPESIDWFE